MRETNFIEQNKKKWDKFETTLKSDQKDPEQLSNLFIEITDDLSYSRTFYPNRSVRVYLNGIAQRVFYSIYKNRKSRVKRFAQFWVQDVPQVLYEARRELLLGFLLFVLAAAIGVLSTYMDNDFPRIILGEDYVDMTFENIENGEPMSVYASGQSTDMFFMIAYNNLRVAFLVFVMGLLFGVGSIYLLMYNGIMVGAFQAMFIREGIYLESVMAIWLHGTIEISCIIVAGAAGISLGKGLAFPGTFTRLQSLQLTARRGMLIMATITPLILLAAFIEGYFTRFTDASYIIRGGVILGSLAFVLFYFVFFPWWRAQRGHISFLRDITLPPTRNEPIEFYKIKHSGELFSDAFGLFRTHIRSIALLAAALAGIYTTILMINRYGFEFRNTMILVDAIEHLFENVAQFFFPHRDFDLLWMCNFVGFTCISYWALLKAEQTAHTSQTQKRNILFYINTAIATVVISFIFNSFLLAPEGIVVLFAVFVVPILHLWQATVFNERTNVFSGLGRSLTLMGGNWTNMMGGYLVILLMCFVFMLLSTAPIVSLYYSVFSTFIPMSQGMARASQEAFYVFVNSFALFFVFPLMYMVSSLGYFSFKETREATDLLAQVPTVGVKHQSYGMEKEA